MGRSAKTNLTAVLSIYKPQKVKKLALNSQLPTVQILANDVQVHTLCLSYLIATVNSITKENNEENPGHHSTAKISGDATDSWAIIIYEIFK